MYLFRALLSLLSYQLYLKQAEIAYIELAQKYNFVTVECSENGKPKDIEAINEIVYNSVKPYMNKRG